jgi:hypothetical protein
MQPIFRMEEPEEVHEKNMWIEEYQKNIPRGVKEKREEYVFKSFYLLFDSRYRDLQVYPNPNSFQIKFSPNGNQFIYQSIYDKHNKLILSEKNIVFGDGSNDNIKETFDNIYSIKCTVVIFPNCHTEVGIYNGKSISYDLFNKSYLYLNIPEIRGPYTGGDNNSYNSFAKLIVDYQSNYNYSVFKFLKLVTASENEYFIYDPILNGKLDKMTLTILDNNSLPYQLNIDKLYIAQFSQGSDYMPFCGDTNYTMLRCTIQMQHPEYSKYCSLYYGFGDCTSIHDADIQVGDLIYFYTTRPFLDQVAYLERDIEIKEYDVMGDTLYLSFFYMNERNEYVDVDVETLFSNRLSQGMQYLVIQTYYLKIIRTEGLYFVVENKIPEDVLNDTVRIGITQSYLPGLQDKNRDSLFCKSGYYVVNVERKNNTVEFDINFPYSRMANATYYENEIFLIQDKLQINYNFEVTIKTKNFDSVSSQLNVSGNN